MRDVCIFVFEMFLKSTMQLQTTRSRRLLNGFWWFLLQNKVEILLVLFLPFPTHFYCVRNTKNFDWSLKLCFVPLISVKVPVLPSRAGSPRCYQCQHEQCVNMQYHQFLRPEDFLVTFQVDGLQFSAQTEHSAMWSSRARKSSGNENAYGWLIY